MSKNIAQYAEAAALQSGDKLLFQRGNNYYSIDATALTSGATTSDTYANVNTAKGGGTLDTGAIYYLTDKYVYLIAIDGDKFQLEGIYFARNADYNGAGTYTSITVANGFTVNATGTNLGVWDTALAPASGDVAIWNNLHWLNITGANGASNPSADAVNWEAVANTNIDVANNYGYIYEFDSIEYDFANDSINRRVDNRGNDIGGGVSTFQWGNASVYDNYVQAGGEINNYNQQFTGGAFEFSGNTIQGKLDLSGVKEGARGTVTNNNFVTGGANSVDIIAANDYEVIACNVQRVGQLATSALKLYPDLYTCEAMDFYGTGQLSTFKADIDLVAAAYAGGTTYFFGDFATSGSVTYMYINQTGSAGNAPPNATYWVEVYDASGAAGTYKLTVSDYFNACGWINLTSTNAAETVDLVVWSDPISDLDHTRAYVKFTAAASKTITFANTATGSVAANGDIIGTASAAIEGSKNEYVIIRYELLTGTAFYVAHVIDSQTAIT